MNTQEKLNKFIGILKRSNLSKEDIVRTLESISNDIIKEVELPREQGKSSFEFKELGETIAVITYRDKKPVRTEIRTRELNWIEDKIRLRFKYGIGLKEDKKNIKYLDSIDLGIDFAEHFSYKVLNTQEYYANRKFQNYFTICLRVLRKKEIIEYKKGRIRLNKTKDL